MKTWARLSVFLGAFLLAACLLPEEPGRTFVSLQIPTDSLREYDTVLIVLVDPRADSVRLDTLWNGAPPREADLAKVKVEAYSGGDVIVKIYGIRGGQVWYERRIRFTGGEAEMEPPVRHDRLPPILTLRISDTAVFHGQPVPDSLVLCQDETDGRWMAHHYDSLIVATGEIEERVLMFRCEDRAGLRSLEGKVTFRRKPWPDTLSPLLTLRGADSLAHDQGQEFEDPGADCRDDREQPYRTFSSKGLDADSPGLQVLEYVCRDKAGNATGATRKVMVVARDATAPVISLNGADSLEMTLGSAYVEAGAACLDDRDGNLPVTIHGAVKTDSLGRQALAYACADKAGNEARTRVRVVVVIETPDTSAPVLTLKGPDSLDHVQGTLYADSGATCVDARDGALVPWPEGAVDTDRLGVQSVGYTCKDSPGNAVRKMRTVRVVPPPDVTAPLMALKGPDSLDLVLGTPYVDSGAACVDARDGDLAAVMTGVVDPDRLGVQVLAFDCRDKAGNAAAQRTRKVRVVLPPDVTAPLLTLKGPDSLDHVRGLAYVDSGAACRDDRDGDLLPAREGAVDTGRIGLQTLAFSCRDAAGNAAPPKARKVRVVLPPDATPPVLALKGRDSVVHEVHKPYVDSGATCVDGRDGVLEPAVAIALDPDSLGDGQHAWECLDAAGNRSFKSRAVRVVLGPDTVKPVLTRLGPDTVYHVIHTPYVDSGGTCRDDRDGPLPVGVNVGQVRTWELGTNQAFLSCRDAALNPAQFIRYVIVVLPPDRTPPVLTLKGPDSLLHPLGTPYKDSGATCVDDRDGPLAHSNVFLDPFKAGEYLLKIECADRANNRSTVTRKVRVARVEVVPAHQDLIMDTTNYTWANSGYTPVLSFGKMVPTPDPWACLLAFDADQADKGNLVRAWAEFHTWIAGNYQAFESRDIVFTVHRVKSAWTEGTGSWYYHDGAYHNGGQSLLANHPPRPAIAEASSEPFLGNGLTGDGRSILRVPNMIPAGKDTLTLSYGSQSFTHGHPGTVPEKRHLVTIRLDLTEYVKSVPQGEDHGLVITSEGVPDGIWINWATKELSDGTMGPRLLLEY